MNLKKLVAALAGAGALVAALPAHAGALAMADLTIKGLGLTGSTTSTQFINAPITIVAGSEGRTGNASSIFNGVVGVNPGDPLSPGNVQGGSATVDVKYRCAGACGAATQALYGGAIENNTTTHLGPVPTESFAIGDMLIQGNALAGPVTGLTRANAQTTGGNNTGSANATILNTASLTASFTANETFSAYLAVNADAWVRTWVNYPPLPGEVSTASAGIGWNIGLQGSGLDVFFRPGQLNVSFGSTDFGDVTQADRQYSFNGFVYSDLIQFIGGQTYTLTANQSSNAIIKNQINEIPEPISLALVGVALLGAGVAMRHRQAK